MIENFINIKNIGRYRDCAPRGDVAFRKATLLFAKNGQGKTILCAILRSLQSGRHEAIADLGGEAGIYRTKRWELE
jgi:wobble nucleotide-excising tRNase